MIKEKHWKLLEKFSNEKEFERLEFEEDSTYLVATKPALPKRYKKRKGFKRSLKIAKALRTNSRGDLKDAFLGSSLPLKEKVSDPKDISDYLDEIPYKKELELDVSPDLIIW